MPVLALRLTAHDKLTAKQQRALKASAEYVDLGIGATFTKAPHDWLVYADARLDLEAAALLACCFKQPNFLPDPNGKPRPETRANIKAAFNWEVPPIPEGVDPYEYTANYNAVNPKFGMWTQLPAGFTPKGE